MALDPAELPDDVDALKALLIAADRRTRDLGAEIESLKLTIAKLQHERFGPSSERARLLDQLELQLGELMEHAAQTKTAAEIAALQPGQSDSVLVTARATPPQRQPARRPLPETLPRERRVEPSPAACPCCGGRLRKLGEDITETLSVCRRSGRWSRPCARSGRAGSARRSRSHRPRRIRSRADAPARHYRAWRR
jgi:transposase